jgi:hypothetical protein
VKGTLWAAYNGVAEYIDYRRFGKASDDRQLNAIWFGEGYSAKARAFSAALWAAYNGVAEYIDYRRFGKASDDRQLNAIWFGEGYSAKARAFSAAQKCMRAWVN